MTAHRRIGPAARGLVVAATVPSRPDPPRASVVIPHLNTPELLVKCLQSVASQRLDHGWFEIIVVDNGSRVPLDVIAASWPGVRFLVERTPGPGPARNLGVAHARAPVLVFTDADCRVAPGWLIAAVRAVERKPAQPVGGDVRIDFRDPRSIRGIEAFEAVFSFRQKMYIRQKGFSITANLAVSREVFDAVGPFAGIDQAEDTDWGQRAVGLGHPTRYVPRMLIFHPARLSVADLERRWARMIGHGYHEVGSGPIARLKWQARAVLVLASALVHTPKLLLSARVPTLTGRVRGIGVLFRIRWFRFREMRRVAREGGSGAQMQWNRA
ncbi:MAG: glycosyltransferase family 2 protein [Sphingomonadaceae bacterium]